MEKYLTLTQINQYLLNQMACLVKMRQNPRQDAKYHRYLTHTDQRTQIIYSSEALATCSSLFRFYGL